METGLTQFARFTEESVSPDTPRLVVELEANTELHGTSPYHVRIIIRQATHQTTPISFFWCSIIEAFSENGFVLLHHIDDGYRKVDTDPARVTYHQLDTKEIGGWDNFLFELWPDTELRFIATLPLKHQNQLVPGETYELYWPGMEIEHWVRGTINRQIQQRRTADVIPERPTQKLILPAGPSVTFRVHPQHEPTDDRIPSRVTFGLNPLIFPPEEPDISLRQSNSLPPTASPTLRISLSTNPRQNLTDPIPIGIKITYDGLQNGRLSDARPITFHYRGFEYTFSRLRPANSDSDPSRQWARVPDNDRDICGFDLYDDPPYQVSIAKHRYFVSLRPGESIYTSYVVQHLGWTNLPYTTTVGDTFRLTYTGQGPEWWDWGDQEDHRDTKVMLDGYFNAPVIPTDQDEERPAIQVKAWRDAVFDVVDLGGQKRNYTGKEWDGGEVGDVEDSPLGLFD